MTNSCILTPSGKFDHVRLLQNVRYVTHLASLVDRVYTVRLVPHALAAAAAASQAFLVSLMPPKARDVLPPFVTSLREDPPTPSELGILTARVLAQHYSIVKGLTASSLVPLHKLVIATDTCVIVRPMTHIVMGVHVYTSTGPLWSICSRYNGDVRVFCEDLWIVTGAAVISQVMKFAKDYIENQGWQTDFASGLVQLMHTRGFTFTDDAVMYSADDLAYKLAPVHIAYGNKEAVATMDQVLSQPLCYAWEKLVLCGCPLLARTRRQQQDAAAEEFLNDVLGKECIDVQTRIMDMVLDQAARLQ